MKKRNEEEIAGRVRTVRTVKEQPNAIRVYKSTRVKDGTVISRNKSLVGDSIEIMMERLREGEGEESIQDRDLVYNDNESGMVNPITNIRSDKFELLLEEKIGEYDHKHRKMKVVKDDEPDEKTEGNGTEPIKE